MISVIEKWKPIEGYEGLYEVSDWGDVKSLNYNHTGKEKILSVGLCWGYHIVGLCKDGISKTHKVHRLVAQAFIPNPDNLPCVNHKDEVRSNNHVGNLEWCSYQYNNNYGTCRQRSIKNKKKKVSQYNLNGEFIKEWDSAKDVQRVSGYNAAHINECCKGKRRTAHNFIWQYA